MKEKEFDIFGIGSPLVDMFIETEDCNLQEFELKKGQMHLMDHEQFSKLKNKIKKEPVKTCIAGDVVNTMMGVSAMGGRAVFCGKVGKDKYADLFKDSLLKDDIKPVLLQCDKFYTGQVISFVTKDAERTMTVHLGASIGLKKDEATLSDIKKSRFLYTSAYVLDSPSLKETVISALKTAKKNKVRIAFDLADPGVIERHKMELKEIIKDYVNILFANETEASRFTGKEDPKDALNELSKLSDIAVVKLGDKGSIIKRKDEIIEINIKKVKAVDTTGAGDMYAAGFLFALTRTNDLKLAASIASFASAKIVEQFGAKLNTPIRDEVEKILNKKKI